jgi:hypothetical protein
MSRPRGSRMSDLAKLANLLARPDRARRSVWHTLAGFDHWVIILIRHTRRGDPPERPVGTVRISPEFLRGTGNGLTAEQLIHERVGQYLAAELGHGDELTLGSAAGAATDAVMATLAELGVTLSDRLTDTEADHGH